MTTTEPDPQRCLGFIRALSAQVERDIAGLGAAAWDGLTNCPPWRVRDLAVHLVSSGEGFVASIQHGLAGSVAPPDAAERQRRHAQLEAAPPQAVAAALGQVTDAFEQLYAGLGPEQLEVICFHRRGNRSVRWYAAHRLAEVAFHSWDLWHSLGQSRALDENVARLLLPMLLESNVPRTYAAGLSTERGQGERYLLTVRDDPTACWLVTIAPDQLTTQPGPADADLRITATAADLALLVYGRAELHTLQASGRAELQGRPSAAERFSAIFPRP